MSIRSLSLFAILFSVGALGFALFTQYVWGLYPCDMCIKQRYGHGLILLCAVLTLVFNKRWLLWATIGAFLITVGIAGYHVGIEEGIFNMGCTGESGEMSIDDLLNRPIVRCDVAAWELFGISMAGWNALACLGAAVLLIWKFPKRQ